MSRLIEVPIPDGYDHRAERKGATNRDECMTDYIFRPDDGERQEWLCTRRNGHEMPHVAMADEPICAWQPET